LLVEAAPVPLTGLKTEFREKPMSWSVILSGLGGAAMLALGSNLILPVGSAIGGVCDLAGIASAVVFFGLMDGE